MTYVEECDEVLNNITKEYAKRMKNFTVITSPFETLGQPSATYFGSRARFNVFQDFSGQK
jgi:hypothetical protein